MLFLLTYYFYIVWQCYKLYAAIYIVTTVYGFTKTGAGFIYRCMYVVGKLMWRGKKKERKVIEKGCYDDWIILDDVSDDGSDEGDEGDEEGEEDEGHIEMIKRIGNT